MPRPFPCPVSVSSPAWYPNTRKREEALVEAYFGIYDGSMTARNKGTLAGGLGAAGQWVIRGAVYRNRQGGVAEKRAGGLGNGERVLPHIPCCYFPHIGTYSDYDPRWCTRNVDHQRIRPVQQRKDAPFWNILPMGVTEKQGATFCFSRFKIL